jgi:hypothetical protein
MEGKNLNLVTLKKANQLRGVSVSFLKQLMREGQLTRFKINSATYVSLSQFDRIAQPITTR